MKVTVISFDFWHYDGHIVDTLKAMGVDAHHINIGAYRHRSAAARMRNAFSKIFLKKNLKNQLRQKEMLEKLEKLGPQDKILVINPELIGREYHEKIRTFTNDYIAYLYDSLARCPAEHLFDLFDEIFSFDKNDAQQYGFHLITNYNYLREVKNPPQPKYDLVYLASFDKRLERAVSIADAMAAAGMKSHLEIIGKKSWKKSSSRLNGKEVIFTTKKIPHEEIPHFYAQGKAVLDLVRDNQTGLSFRIFEAMALKKKIVTDNLAIKDYDFYNPNNILLLGENDLIKFFFETPYQELPKEIYEKYTVESWVKTVFGL